MEDSKGKGLKVFAWVIIGVSLIYGLITSYLVFIFYPEIASSSPFGGLLLMFTPFIIVGALISLVFIISLITFFIIISDKIIKGISILAIISNIPYVIAGGWLINAIFKIFDGMQKLPI